MEIDFSNKQVDTLSLPSVKEIEFKGLNKDYLTVGLIANAILWIIISIGIVTLTITKSSEFPVWLTSTIYAFLLFLVVSSFVLQIIGFKRKQYALRERDILYKKGYIWRSFIAVPFNRVQHAEVHQGPLERLFDLSNLRIYTAGGSSSDLSIPGLFPEEANRIKHFIIAKTSLDEEE